MIPASSMRQKECKFSNEWNRRRWPTANRTSAV